MTSPKGRHAVYVGTIPKDWRPESVIEVPEHLNDLDLLEGGLTLCQATRLVCDHNKLQLLRSIPGNRWAILILGVTRP